MHLLLLPALQQWWGEGLGRRGASGLPQLGDHKAQRELGRIQCYLGLTDCWPSPIHCCTPPTPPSAPAAATAAASCSFGTAALARCWQASASTRQTCCSWRPQQTATWCLPRVRVALWGVRSVFAAGACCLWGFGEHPLALRVVVVSGQPQVGRARGSACPALFHSSEQPQPPGLQSALFIHLCTSHLLGANQAWTRKWRCSTACLRVPQPAAARSCPGRTCPASGRTRTTCALWSQRAAGCTRAATTRSC